MLGLQNDLYLATLPPPVKSIWWPQSRDCVCFSILTTVMLHITASMADTNGILRAPSIFVHQQLNDTIVHCARYKESPEIQDCELQTGSTYMSACSQDKNTISLAKPMFSGFNNPADISPPGRK